MPKILAKGFACGRCIETIKGTVKLNNHLPFCDLKLLFCYLEIRLKASGGSKAVAARVGWVTLEKLGSWFMEERFR